MRTWYGFWRMSLIMTKTQTEAIFRKALIKHLRKHHCSVLRIEPTQRGKFGAADLWVSCIRTGWAGWVEVKSPRGYLSKDQREFESDCMVCGVRYIIARRVEDIDVIIPSSFSSRYNHIEDFYRRNP